MRPLAALALIGALPGCIAYTVVDTAVDVTASVVETGVDAAGVVVDATAAAVDAVTGDDEEGAAD
jgi:hypothetical protein